MQLIQKYLRLIMSSIVSVNVKRSMFYVLLSYFPLLSETICDLEFTKQAPDPTPSLAPNTSKLGDQDDRKISSSDPIHQTETDGNASSTQQNSDDIPEYLSDAANFISMALQVKLKLLCE